LNCVTCNYFRFHLARNTEIGICKKYSSTALVAETCRFWTEREFPELVVHPLTINGKTHWDFVALNKGYCVLTGLKLAFYTIASVADKYNIPHSYIEKFTNQKETIKQHKLEL